MKKVALSLLFCGGVIFGQEAKVLTLSDAISYALENKADAKKALLDIRKGDAQIAETKSRAYPNISFSSNTTYNPLQQETVLPGEIFGQPGQQVKVAFGQKWTSSNNVQLSQVLFNQAVFTGLKAAKSKPCKIEFSKLKSMPNILNRNNASVLILFQHFRVLKK